MSKKKVETLVNLAENGGNDADVLLLEEIERIEEIINQIEKEKEIIVKIPEVKFPESVKMEIKGISVISIKGDKGERGPTGRDGQDGKSIKGDKGDPGISSNPQEIIEEIKKQLPPPFLPPPPLTGDETIEIINSDDTEKKIKKEKIEGLEEIERLARQKGNTIIGGGSGGGHIVKTHDLSASLDGSTKTFSLPAFWRVLLVLSASFPYGAARETVDWTQDAANSQISFTTEIDAATTLQSGQALLILYAEA